ncbi:subtilisin-like protein [Atractiella rhizophila]|nr:subtilisin-like protein [Atractiella rhizophila]
MLVQTTTILSLVATLISTSQAISTGKPNWARNTYIVELAKDTSADQAVQVASAARKANHKRFYDHLSKRGTEFQVEQEYDNDKLFHGASITFGDGMTLSEIASLEGVQKVWPVRYYTPHDYESRKHHYDNVNKKRHHRLAEEAMLKKRAYKPLPASVYKNDKFAPHVQVGADKLHEQGVLGKGVKVAIVDTGVDYTHPALGGCFGPGCKVTFGLDLVGDNYGAGAAPVVDKDPYDSCNIHGTHVTGIVGADWNAANPLNFTGIAPYAELGMYRIFGCKGGFTSTDLIIKAFLQAFEDGANVITMSVGGVSGWTEDAGSVVADRINALGRITTISAGNDGVEGLFYSSGAANGINVWSIASINSLQIYTRKFSINTGKTGTYISVAAWGVSGLGIYATSTEEAPTDDGCSAFSLPTGFNANKTVVIIRRGTCPFLTKIGNAVTAGAKYVLIADTNGIPYFLGEDYGTPTSALVDTDTGDYLRRRFRENKKTVLDFTDETTIPIANYDGGYNSDFTTYGPTNDMYQQPSFAGVGGNYLSTYPVWAGSYNVISGTSMACPQVGGSAALWLSVRKNENLSPLQIKALFSASASFQYLSSDAPDVLSPVVRTGSGIINVANAVNTKTLVQPYALYLNDSQFFEGSQTIKLTNLANSQKTYTITHEAAASAYLYDEGETIYPSVTPEHTTDVAASVTLSHNRITVAGVNEASVTIKIKKPADNARYPVYSGFIVFTSGSEVLKVPYFGVAGSLYNTTIIDYGSKAEGTPMPFIWTVGNPTSGPISGTGGTVQVGSKTYTLKGNSFPTFFFRLAMGTARFTVDLIPSSQKVPTTVDNPYLVASTAPSVASAGKDHQVSTESSLINNIVKRASYDSIPVLGNVYGGDYWPRNSLTDPTDGNYENYYTWDGTLSPDGVSSVDAENGSYRLYFRALKINGNPENNDDYESWVSNIITIKRSS